MIRFLPLVLKTLWRNRTRSLLTAAGVCVAAFLFCGIQAMQRGVEKATRVSAADNVLVVYRKDRFCPFTSQLPQIYDGRIARLPGVKSVVPTRIVVSNCRTSLDVITFRGVPEESLYRDLAPKWQVVAGSLEDWKKRSDAVVIGESLANRPTRLLKPGMAFNAAGTPAFVAAVIRSDEPQDGDVAYAHLDYLQRNAGKLGVVTQFNVAVNKPENMKPVAEAIDALFKDDQAPTATFSEKAFAARAAADALAIVGFTRWMAWACAAAMLMLVANAIVLSVQDRVRDHAVLQTLGFAPSLIARLIVAESVLITLLGGILGSLGAWALGRFGGIALSADGITLTMDASPLTLLVGLIVSAAIGVGAGLLPAWQASRREIAACFRAV